MSGDGSWYDRVSRDPDEYWKSEHAFIQGKKRSIPDDVVTDLIKDGVLQEAKGGYPWVRFIDDPDYLNDSIGVVANADIGEIRTVFWNTQYDHPEMDIDPTQPRAQGGLTR